jgi:hypothetical protein
MNISSLAFLASPIARQIVDQLFLSAAVEQLFESTEDASPTCLADLDVAEALAGLALLQHDDGKSFLARCSVAPERLVAGQKLLALLRELRALLARP